MGLASLLIDGHTTMKPADVLESARYIHQSAERLHRLIENFLAYAQIELMAKDAKSILSTASTSFTATGAHHYGGGADGREPMEATTGFEIGGSSLHRAGHCGQSAKDRRGTAWTMASSFPMRERPVRVITGALEQTFSLHVINTGRGMTQEQIAKIGPHMQFEREKYEQQGAGLGLIIAKRLTELNGGTFSITSTPGKETRATVTFPAPSAAQKR